MKPYMARISPVFFSSPSSSQLIKNLLIHEKKTIRVSGKLLYQPRNERTAEAALNRTFPPWITRKKNCLTYKPRKTCGKAMVKEKLKAFFRFVIVTLCFGAISTRRKEQKRGKDRREEDNLRRSRRGKGATHLYYCGKYREPILLWYWQFHC